MKNLSKETTNPASAAAQDIPQRLVPFSENWHVTKIVLRSISLLFATILFALALKSAFMKTASSAWVFGLPAALGPAIWDVAEFITLCARRRSARRGIHPGAHVGVELSLWLFLIPMGTLQVILSSAMQAVQQANGTWEYVWKEPSWSAITCEALTFLLLIIHFILFCRACRETSQRNKVVNPIKMMYIPGGGKPFAVVLGTAEGTAAYDTEHTDQAELEPPMAAHVAPHHTGEEVTGEDQFVEENWKAPPQKEVIPGFIR